MKKKNLGLILIYSDSHHYPYDLALNGIKPALFHYYYITKIYNSLDFITYSLILVIFFWSNFYLPINNFRFIILIFLSYKIIWLNYFINNEVKKNVYRFFIIKIF